jgi:hypothetical protein
MRATCYSSVVRQLLPSACERLPFPLVTVVSGDPPFHPVDLDSARTSGGHVKLRGTVSTSNEVSANFCGQMVPRGQSDGSLWLYSRLSRPEPLLFIPSSSSTVLTRLSEPRCRPSTSQSAGNRTRPLDL